MVAFSHSVWSQAEQIHLLLPDPSCLFRPERGQAQVFERMTGPDLWKEKPGRQPLECSALTTSLTQHSGSLLMGEGRNSHLRIPLPSGGCIPGGRDPARLVLAWVLSHCHTQLTRAPRHRSPFAGFLLLEPWGEEFKHPPPSVGLVSLSEP